MVQTGDTWRQCCCFPVGVTPARELWVSHTTSLIQLSGLGKAGETKEMGAGAAGQP